MSGRLRFSNASACLAAADAGLGVAYLPEFVATEALAQGKVVPVLPDLRCLMVPIHALYPSGRNLPNKVRVLVDFLVEALRRMV